MTNVFEQITAELAKLNGTRVGAEPVSANTAVPVAKSPSPALADRRIPPHPTSTPEEVADAMRRVAEYNAKVDANIAQRALTAAQIHAANAANAERKVAAEALVRGIASNGVTTVENGVKITRYPAVELPPSNPANASKTPDIGNRLAEERLQPKSVDTRHALKAPYNGGDHYKPHADALRGIRSIGPVGIALQIVRAPIHAYDASKLLASVAEEHKLNLPVAAKAEYQMLFAMTQVSETVTGGQSPALMQEKLVEWGKRYNIPPAALTQLQSTDIKLDVKQMGDALRGREEMASSEKASEPNFAAAKAQAATLEHAATVTRMASLGTDLVAPNIARITESTQGKTILS